MLTQCRFRINFEGVISPGPRISVVPNNHLLIDRSKLVKRCDLHFFTTKQSGFCWHHFLATNYHLILLMEEIEGLAKLLSSVNNRGKSRATILPCTPCYHRLWISRVHDTEESCTSPKQKVPQHIQPQKVTEDDYYRLWKRLNGNYPNRQQEADVLFFRIRVE